MRPHRSQAEKWILLSIPLIFILASLFHFLYELSGKNALVGLLAAVNESIWEHNKMVFLPPLLFWLGFYFLRRRAWGLAADKWFTAALCAVLSMQLAIPLLYYGYTGAFGVELLWVDIGILLLAVAWGQVLALHVYRHAEGLPWLISLAVFCLLLFLFGFFTFHPPHLPLFQDGPTGTFGAQ